MFYFKNAVPFLGIILILLLSSCSHVQKDGPPCFYVDESKIPNAIPRPEPLAKYGNYKSYVTLGKRYHTLKTSKNYDEVGMASWYGTQFHHKKTSSGEVYNLLGMTAAHKTLPLPTYVEVINLANHRRIIVKVNDRGPFVGNRIIDLSYVAAKKLGMIGHGTTKVRVRAINPKSFGTKELFFVDSKETRANVYLQVGAFRNKIHAEKLQTRLSSLFNTPVKIFKPNANTKLYRVKIGPIHDLQLANKMTNRLKLLGIASNRMNEGE